MDLLLFFIVKIFVYVSSFVISETLGVIVTTKNGDVEGFLTKSGLNKEYYFFTGIPFAEPPIGKYRFMDTVPVRNWNGTLKATKRAPDCVQPNELEILGDEDCLYLNVFTPQLPNKDRSNLKPVIFCIFGGYFYYGSTPTFEKFDLFFEHDIVIVTVNYRLNIFGFLSSGTEHIPGNAGLKDLIMALKWVKENIEGFGGDPNSITLYGESSGAASVHYLMISPLTKGLFRNAISRSGSCIASWVLKSNPMDNFFKIADELKMPRDNFSLIVEKLQSIDYTDIFNIYQKTMTIKQKLDDIPYIPCIEPVSENAAISDSPSSILQQGNFNAVPYMVGVTSCEGVLFNYRLSPKAERDFFSKNIYELLPILWVSTLKSSTVMEEIEMKLKEHYFPDNDTISTQALIDNRSDIGFYFPLVSTLLLHKKLAPVYTYIFGFEGDLTLDNCGVGHGGDYIYFWDDKTVQKDNRTTALAKKMMKHLINFVKFGNPTPIEDPELDNVIWKQVKSDSIADMEYLSITDTLTMSKGLFTKRTEFWTNLWKNYCFPNEQCRYYNI